MRRPAVIFTAICCCWAVAPYCVVAQQEPPTTNQLSAFVQVDETSPEVHSKVERLERYLNERRWSEAVELAQQVIEEHGHHLWLANPEQLFSHHIPVAQYCCGLLASHSREAPELLERYRLRTDLLAQRIYDRAIQEHDQQALERLVDFYFLSSVGDDSLLTLGDWALQSGEPQRARQFWERLSPQLRDRHGQLAWISLSRSRPAGTAGGTAAAELDPWSAWSGGGDELPAARPFVPGWHYPDAEIPAAEVWARFVWTSIYLRQFERAEKELLGLMHFHPQSTGGLGGRVVPLSATLEKMLEDARSAATGIAATGIAATGGDADWVTYGGMPDRNGRGSPGTVISDRPLWSIELPRVAVQIDPPRLAESENLLVHFPIVVGKTVLVHQEGALRAVDLSTGRSRYGALNVGDESDLARIGIFSRLPDRTTGEGTLGYDRFTCSADGDRLVVRTGLRVTYENADSLAALPADYRSQVVVFDLAREGRLIDGFPQVATEPEWTFDGVPLLEGTRLYTAMRRVDDVRPRVAVACFEVPGGRLLWRQFVAAAQTPGGGDYGEITHTLLTLAGDQVLVNTNLGAIAALRKRDGRVRWLVRYPRADYPVVDPDRSDDHFQRDLVPVVAANGLVYSMPQDCRRLFAVDAATGWLQWASAQDMATDAKFLLGVADGHLIASGDSLHWFDALTGHKRTQYPAPYKHALGLARAQPRGYGRGVLVGNAILWTSEDQLYAFQAGQFDVHNQVTTPLMVRPPQPLAKYGATGGNLVAAGEVLLIAAADRLYAFRRREK